MHETLAVPSKNKEITRKESLLQLGISGANLEIH